MSASLHLLHTHLESQAPDFSVPVQFCEANDNGFLLVVVFVVLFLVSLRADYALQEG